MSGSGPCVALIVAAGRGERFGDTRPKQYHLLAGRPVLRHSLEAFAAHPQIDAVRAVIQPDARDLYDEAAAGLDLLEPVPGGATRQASVLAGLESLAPMAPTKVLIHDGARPIVDAGLVDRVCLALDESDAVIPALAVTDTLKRGEDGRITDTVSRAGLFRAQTPQGFAFDAVIAAHRSAAGEALTDDAAVAERAGLGVAIVEGDEWNLKITDASDMARAEAILSGRTVPRVGHGFDVHRLVPGTSITLCGVTLDFDRSLSGHSDADVGLHALTDAILGALGDGDIGSHFPPTDPKWQGADSAVFLAHACDLVRERGGRIEHVDVTLVCERPKVGPHRDAMRARIAEILSAEAGSVSVKATTTEGLGFTGRGEGIAAYAMASLSLPRFSSTNEQEPA